jgi:SAM-dependent methyltransferase
MVRQHVNPLLLRFANRPEHFTSWSALFANPTLPLFLDIGCAKGALLKALALRRPAENFLGIEIREEPLLYALKAYDFKNNGRVICTQPRIPPTINNAERIALELGVQIIKPEKILNNITMVKSDDFYVQMKHSGDSHIKNDCPHLTLKIMTDGTLYEELQTNPLMKQQIFNNTKTDFVYGFENYYDIIIVDESHEHNTNMDLILTLMKQSCMYNNSLRLIIMSATMDDDEPIYRSYFKAINDNLLYPIKSTCVFNINSSPY